MAKRQGGSVHSVGTKSKRRKGIKIRTISIPDSGDEDTPPSNINVEYARLLKTRVATSGKADSVTVNTVPLFETKVTAHDDLPEPNVDSYEVVPPGNPTPSTKVKKKKKKKNDSVRPALCTK